MNTFLTDRAWLERRYLVDEAPVAVIAAEAGCDRSTVHRALQCFEVPLRGASDRRYWDDILTPRMLAAEVTKGRSHVDIAHQYGAPPRIVSDHLLRLGLGGAVGDAELARRYSEGESLAALADSAQLSTRTVARRLRASGVTLRSAGRPSGGPAPEV